MSKKYSLRKPIPEKVDKLFEKHPPLVRSLLYSRGIEDLDSADDFLNPKYENLFNPFLLKGMDKAVGRIIKAMESDEKIAIFSDYDADGIPGAVALHDFFKKIGYDNFINYIPLRNEEGFGLNHDAVDNLASQGVKLVITIDCGITDVEQVETANSHGINVVITDHHIPGKKLPKAFAIVNPKQKGDEYPEKILCGSGVIFKVIQALVLEIRHSKLEIAPILPPGWEKWLLDMVGLATLSDMVPLSGENRILSYFGMKVLQKSPRVGLLKLLSLLKIDGRTMTEDDIGFMVTPRINAASRMGIPLDAFKLLSTTDEVEAGVLAQHLNNKNDERKGVVGAMVKEVKKRIEESDVEMKQVLVFGNPEWKPSLLGLVASSFGDEHGRPVFLWGRSDSVDADFQQKIGTKMTIIKGSCRAGGDTDIVKLMEKVKDIFVDYGGHKGAGGFSILQENIHQLEERLNKAFLELSAEGLIVSEVSTTVDKKLTLDDVSWETYSSVEKFAPFGLDNPKPLFLFENIPVSAMRLFGKEQNHLELKFKNSQGKFVTAIAFFQNGDRFPISIKEGSMINLVATLEKSAFRGFPELRLRIVDVY